MNDVKRYLINWHMEEMFEHPTGDVVKVEDFNTLAVDCEEVRLCLKQTLEREDALVKRNAALGSLLFRMAQKGSQVPGFPSDLMREARLMLK